MNNVRNVDCTRYRWEDHDIDVMITDPPYRAHVHKNATSQSRGGGARHRDMGFDHITPELRDFTCALAARVKRWSCIFTDVESISLWVDNLARHKVQYIRAIPWVRWSMPQLSGDRPPQGCEFIILAHNRVGKKHWNGPGNLTHMAHTCMRGEDKHKAEKPLDLMLDLVSYFSDKGELVVDPFAGHCTTGVACNAINRRFVGTEIDPGWYAKGLRRVLDKDDVRYVKWLASQETLALEKERMRNHTAKVRSAL